MKSTRRSQCIHCCRKIVERPADQQYITEYGDDGLAWSDTVEQRSMCLISHYTTGHVTAKEYTCQ